jgi:hypothetical protein
LAITLEDAQRLELAAPLRLKFASFNEQGNLWPNSDPDYPPFFEALPPGCERTELGLIETRREHRQRASRLSDGQFELLAVEHETGIELILIPVGVGLLTNAIWEFTKWAWKRWQQVRSDRSVSDRSILPATLIIEVPRSDPGVPPLRIILPPPVSDAELAQCWKVADQLRPAVA